MSKQLTPPSFIEKSMKIPKELTEPVNLRRTDNTIAKRKSTKHTHKTKDRETRTPLKTGDELRCPYKPGNQEVMHLYVRRVSIVTLSTMF